MSDYWLNLEVYEKKHFLGLIRMELEKITKLNIRWKPFRILADMQKRPSSLSVLEEIF